MRKSRLSRTRGPDPLEPLNRPSVPKTLRRGVLSPLDEHRVEMICEARELGLSAATDFEIAQHFGVSQRTIDAWKRRDPQFAAALTMGKDIADGKIVASLYHKARGYSFKSEKIFQHEGAIVRAETIEHVPPSDTAIIFWLKNRQREQWADVNRVEVSGSLDVNVDARALALSMLATIRAGLAAPLIEATANQEPVDASTE